MSTPTAYYRTRPKRNGDGFIAWAALEPLKSEHPLHETAANLYFNFGADEDSALQKLTLEMEGIHGKLRWWRQQ